MTTTVDVDVTFTSDSNEGETYRAKVLNDYHLEDVGIGCYDFCGELGNDSQMGVVVDKAVVADSALSPTETLSAQKYVDSHLDEVEEAIEKELEKE